MGPLSRCFGREWALAWEGIDFRPARDPATSAGLQLPVHARSPLHDFSGEKLVYPSEAVAKAAAARGAQLLSNAQQLSKATSAAAA